MHSYRIYDRVPLIITAVTFYQLGYLEDSRSCRVLNFLDTDFRHNNATFCEGLQVLLEVCEVLYIGVGKNYRLTVDIDADE